MDYDLVSKPFLLLQLKKQKSYFVQLTRLQITYFVYDQSWNFSAISFLIYFFSIYSYTYLKYLSVPWNSTKVLILSQDFKLICSHDAWLNDSTNVASFPQFANRIKTYVYMGVRKTDYFTIDFTLEELQTIKKVRGCFVNLQLCQKELKHLT